jgi:hypothetical protein
MQDDFVCGSDYENCLDPTGKYVVNGTIVVGSTPGVSGGAEDGSSGKFKEGLYAAWNYPTTTAATNSAWLGAGTISNFINADIVDSTTPPSSTPKSMVQYLQGRIGYVTNNGKSLGLCISVLNKCQNYTYTASGDSFKGKNDVTTNYLMRTLVQIKTAQDTLLANYAQSCVTEVASCLSTNNYSTNEKTAEKACSALIKTCTNVIYGSTGLLEAPIDSNTREVIIAANGGYACPANSKVDLTLTGVNSGGAGVYGAVKATSENKFCKCNNTGSTTNGCPAVSS